MTESPEAPGGSLFSLLADRPVRNLTGMQFAFSCGVFLQASALGKQVFDITGRELDLGWLGLAEFLPAAVLVLVTGAVADRFDRRRVATIALFGELLCSLALTGYALTRPTRVWPLFLIAVCFGTSRAFVSPATRAMPPMVAPEGTLPRVIALNSNIEMQRGSPQYIWLQRELQTPSKCTLAFWHHPRFTSGPNLDNPNTGPLWDLLYQNGVDVILNGHDHLYERFLPMNPDGQLDRDKGIREFVAGTGGALLYKFASVKPNSASRYEGYGVLKMILGDGRYDWEFLPVTPGFSDTGFDSCK